MDTRKDPETIRKEIKKALSIPGDHGCRNNPENICPVASPVLDDVVFVSNRHYPQCPHYKAFGYGGFCNLPARKEIYDHYGV